MMRRGFHLSTFRQAVENVKILRIVAGKRFSSSVKSIEVCVVSFGFNFKLT